MKTDVQGRHIDYTDADVDALVSQSPPAAQPHMRDFIEQHRAEKFYTNRPGGAIALWIDAQLYAEVMLGWPGFTKS